MAKVNYGAGTRQEPALDIFGETPNVPQFELKMPKSEFKLSQADISDSSKASPISIQTAEQDQVSATREQAAATIDLKQKISSIDEATKQQNRREQLMAAGARFGIDMLNTFNQYRNVSGVAQFNIMQARNQAADAIYRGRQAGFQRQSEGIRAGEQSLLAMAAQGQSVSGESVQKIQRSYEAVGIENAMREEINGIREALGFQLEEIGQEYQLEMAAGQKDASVLSSVLQLSASAYGAGAFDGGL
jgi:hypothetical protein